MEFGYGQTSSPYAVEHFDSIISLTPDIPELYLARAIARYKMVPYHSHKKNEMMQDAIRDVDKARALGMKDYRTHLFKAEFLHYKGDSQAAFNEINRAIEMNEKDPRSFLVRYYIKRDKADHERYLALCKRWRFHDY